MSIMSGRQRLVVFSTAVLIPSLLIGCGTGSDRGVVSSDSEAVSSFEVDPSWPLEMPNDWIMGSVLSLIHISEPTRP